MGRELRRVPLDFSWPINKTWEGFLNPLYAAAKCKACNGSGYAIAARRLSNRWYGNVNPPFRPEDNGSIPFKPEDEAVMAFAKRNVAHSPNYYGTGADAVRREAERLCQNFNRSWSHHLNTDDVAALIKANRLYDFTHTFDPVNRWQPKVPPYVPTPHEVNIWSISGMGHDAINQSVCVRAECERRGVAVTCASCDGNGDIWPTVAAKEAYDAWEQIDPPSGDGYQIWETVSEGSPISPVFASPEELARHMAGTKWGGDDGTPYETWLAFIRGPGWAPSGMLSAAGFQTGVVAVVENMQATL
jgi:hypothetical protein